MAVASPCINVCRMDEHSALCVGCFRTLDEIAGWSSSNEDQRSEVLARVVQRRANSGAAAASLRTQGVQPAGKERSDDR